MAPRVQIWVELGWAPRVQIRAELGWVGRTSLDYKTEGIFHIQFC